MPGGNRRNAYGAVLNGLAGRHSRRQKVEDEDKVDKKGGPQYLATLVSRMGKKYIRLALTSHEKGAITALDLGNYLDIDLKHLDGIYKRVKMAE